MQLYFSRLQVESTRRCNQTCAHCCRGNAQNVDLTKEIVDLFFEKNSIHTINTLLFSGGESTLNGFIIKYFIEQIIERDIDVDMFLFGINGLSYNEEMIQGLNKLKKYILRKSNYKKRCPGLLMISQDQFHQEANPEVIQKLRTLSYLSPIEKVITPPDRILPYGRALENHLSTQSPNLEGLTNYQKNYKVTEYQGQEYLVISYQYLAANGNVINDGCQSYDLMDQYVLGNVKEQSIAKIILKRKK